MTRFRSCPATKYVLAATVALISSAGWADDSQAQARQLVRGAVKNEIKAGDNGPRFMYTDRAVYKDHSVTKEVIETPDGGLSRVIARNGHPLTPDEQAAADQKLKSFANDPAARQKKKESSKEDDQRADDIMRSLPDAFLYTPAGTEKGPNGHELVKFTFKADPNWTAPTRETRVLEGMQGTMVIDKTAMRLAEINGELFKAVDFGWGILGRLNEGGKFIIHQADVGDGRWEMTLETLKFDGKILLLKSLNIDSTETMTDFRPVPQNVTTAQALELLQKSTDVVAVNGGGDREKHK